MKLRAKSDHRIREFGIDERNSHPYYTRDEYGNTCHYKTLKEVADNWEDVPEDLKKHYEILDIGVVIERNNEEDDIFRCARQREIGNYFETKEEAELALHKLKAWKRLEDKGFRFVGWQDSVSVNNPDMILFKLNEDAWENDTCNDLDLLFGGEE